MDITLFTLCPVAVAGSSKTANISSMERRVWPSISSEPAAGSTGGRLD